MNSSIAKLGDKIIEARRINSDEVKTLRRGILSEDQIVEHIFDEHMVDRDEAEMLFAINDAVSKGDYDESWRDLFVEAITSHMFKDEISPGGLDAEEAQFLISAIENDGRIDDIELELLVNVSASVESEPEFFQKYVLEALRKDLLKAGVIDEKGAQRIRRVILGTGSSSGQTVDAAEYAWLRQIDEDTKGKQNHFSWEILKREVHLV